MNLDQKAANQNSNTFVEAILFENSKINWYSLHKELLLKENVILQRLESEKFTFLNSLLGVWSRIWHQNVISDRKDRYLLPRAKTIEEKTYTTVKLIAVR